MNTILAVILILLLLGVLGGLPAWGYHNYGWGPSGILILLVVVIILLMAGKL